MRYWFCIQNIEHDTVYCNRISRKKKAIGCRLTESLPARRRQIRVAETTEESITHCKYGLITNVRILIDLNHGDCRLNGITTHLD